MLAAFPFFSLPQLLLSPRCLVDQFGYLGQLSLQPLLHRSPGILERQSVKQCAEVLRPSGELGWLVTQHQALQLGDGNRPKWGVLQRAKIGKGIERMPVVQMVFTLACNAVDPHLVIVP